MKLLPITFARALCLASGLVSLGTMTGAPAIAQTLTKVSMISIPIDVSGTAYYAVDMGFFKQHGLDVDIQSMQNGAAAVEAIASGKIDFGSGGTTSIALARERGIPLVMVAPSAAYSVAIRSHALVVAPDSSIKTPKDLVGKTLGSAGLKTIGDVALHAWLEKNGVDYNSVKMYELPFASMQAALMAGRIDAADLEVPYLTADLAAGDRIIGNVFDAIGSTWIEGAYFTTTAYAAAHPDVIKKFADAIAEASDWANKNPAEAWKVLDKYTNSTTPPGTKHVLYPERLTASAIQPVIDVSAKYGLLKASFPAKDLFAPGIGN